MRYALVILSLFGLTGLLCCKQQEQENVPVYHQRYSDTMRSVLKNAATVRKENLRNGFYAYLQALELAKKLKDPPAIVEAYRRSIFIGGVLLYKTDSAKLLAKEAIAYGEQLNDPNTLCEMYGLLGVTYQVVGMVDSAVGVNQQALFYMDQDNAPDSLKNWPLYINIADLYGMLGNQPLAIEYTKKYLLEYAQKIKDTLRMISAYNNMANYYTYANKWDSASINIREAYRLDQLKGENFPFVFLGMAAMYNNNKIFDSAYIFGQKSLEGYKKKEDHFGIAKSITTLLEIAVDSRDNASGAAMLQESVTKNVLYDKSLPPKQQKALSESAWQIYNAIGQTDSAYKYLQKSHSFASLIRDLETNKDLEKYELERKKVMQENVLLAKQLQIKNKDNLILLLALLSAVATALTAIIFAINKRKRVLQEKRIELLHKEKIWEGERAQLKGQLEERNRISRELHDDLGATLTSIALRSAIIRKNIPELKDEVGEIAASANNMADTLNEIVWSLNSRNDSLLGLFAYIRKFATSFLAQANINVLFTDNLPAKDIEVDSATRRSIYLSTKEIINNIVKHSYASQVNICFNFDSNMLTIIIKDNGNGMQESSSKSGGNGLHNIKRNMELIDGWYSMKENEGLEIAIGTKLHNQIT